MTEYQRKQRERPTLNDASKKQNTEPLNKKFKRKSSVEPLEDRGSPLPTLPDDLKEKQGLIDVAAGRSKQLSPTPPPAKPEGLTGYKVGARLKNGNIIDKRQSVEEIVENGMRNPLEIIDLIRERRDIGFLYMAAAVSRSSIEYSPYNLKYDIYFIMK